VDRLVEKIRTGDELEVRLMENVVINKTQNESYPLRPIGDVLPILEAGDVFKYAKSVGMVSV
jgi:3-isopropylmalate/(R)-2-methylmalate dehydratase small subunit